MRRYAALAGLYMAQGLPFGFFSHAVPVLLNRTHPPEIVGLSSLLAIPWGLKFLFGPFADWIRGGRLGPRTTAILPLNLLSVASLVVLGFSNPSADHLAPLLIGFFVVSLFSAMQDVATDGLALDVLDENERGRGGAIQVGAQRAGIIAGGGGVLAIIDRLGYREAFWLMAAATFLFTLPVLGIDERRYTKPAPAGPRGTGFLVEKLKLLGTFFQRDDAWKVVGLLVAFKVGDALCAGMVTRWFVKQGLTNTDIALSRGLVGGLAAIAGAIAGGILFRALGRRSGLAILGGLQTLAIVLFIVLDLIHPVGSAGPGFSKSVFYVASVVEHVFGAAATAALFARMMDLTRDEARATDYTMMACVLVAVTGIGIVASGFLTKALGLRGLFIVATAAGVLAPLAALRLTPRVVA